MSVYTSVSEEEMNSFAKDFDLGSLLSFSGVDQGVENTTYFLDFEKKKAVLQVFEEHKSYEVPFFLDLNRRLFRDGIPTAVPFSNKKGFFFNILHGKAAVLYPMILGKSMTQPDQDACRQIGAIIASIHNLSKGYPLSRKNHRWFDWWESKTGLVKTLVSKEQRQVLESQVERTKDLHESYAILPKGLIHGDLFRDNVLFYDNQISGIIDFYNSCEGLFIYDLAIIANDWCSLPDGTLDPRKTRALINSYETVRRLTKDEKDLWPIVIETAAFRFWILRLVALWRKNKGGHNAPTHIKNPQPFFDILNSRRLDPQTELIRCTKLTLQSAQL